MGSAGLFGARCGAGRQSGGSIAYLIGYREPYPSFTRIRLGKGYEPLSARDVLVIDEAGMIGSRQLSRVLEATQEAGAKVVLIGDARQLQPIEAGAAFRAIAEQVGMAEIHAVRRQREAWAQRASQAFARGDVKQGLAAYAQRGHVQFLENRQAA